AVAEQPGDALIPMHDEEIELAVAVEISSKEPPRARERGIRLRALKGAVAVAEQYAHVTAAILDSEVELAVVIEVPGHDRDRRPAHGKARGRGEGPATVAEQHADAVLVHRREVELAVVIEVACDEARCVPSRVGVRWREPAVPRKSYGDAVRS